jgi:hypothetical protein
MTLRTMIAGGIAAAALLSGCGGSSAPPSRDSASRNTDVRAALLGVSRCMREHGYPRFPDPVQNPQGDWTFPESSQIPRRGPTACDSIARSAKTLAGRGGKRRNVSAADIALARGFAKCMREHGVADFPDPDEKGGFRMPARLRPPNGTSILRGPEQSCRQYMPKKGVRVDGGP